ncbi:MAG: hypothetical protein RL134_1863 [Actinomycetota bacterium]|jgi:hypothetical protein
MTRCAETAAAEPLSGTAPRARWWWLIEVPGAWGRKAIADCRVPAVRSLSSDEDRRVLLVRRPGRHPATDARSPLRVWIAGALPDDPPPRIAIADDPDEIRQWPIEGPASAVADPDAPILAVCTNSSRDACCGIDGRALVTSLSASSGVWECSHLGGHRFAPTALLVRSGLVYGRLTEPIARHLLVHGPDPETSAWIRGRSALEPAIQAAEAHLLARGTRPDVAGVHVEHQAPDRARVTFSGHGSLELSLVSGEPRPASCGAAPEAWSAWRVVDPA